MRLARPFCLSIALAGCTATTPATTATATPPRRGGAVSQAAVASAAPAPGAVAGASTSREAEFPVFVGPVTHPAWARSSTGSTRLAGVTRANFDAAPIPYGDVPLMDAPSACADACARYLDPDSTAPMSSLPENQQTQDGWTMNASRRDLDRDRNGVVEWTVLGYHEETGALSVEHIRGRFHPESHEPIAYTRASVTAAPVVAREIYVFRSCEAGCDRAVGDPARVERIWLVGPPADWTGSSDAEQGRAIVFPFGVVSARVAIGEGDSATLNYTSSAAAWFAHAAPPRVGGAYDSSSVMVDVIATEGTSPELTFYRGRILASRDPRSP